MNKHVIVVSVDALVFEDLEYALTLPNFSRVMKDASIIERVKTIYPSLTHPVHATLISGAPAGKTGIINNYKFNRSAPTESTRWYDELADIKCDTLLHAAKRKGLTTACASWPLTVGGGEVIDYLVPCILNYRHDESGKSPIDVFRECGAGENVIDILTSAIEKYGHRDRHPEIDALQAYCTAEIIKKYKPNLLFTHPAHVDHKRHSSGVFSNDVKDALRLTDEWIGMILDAVDEAGIADVTDVIILSDHGQIDVTRSISPNVYLREGGYIRTDADGEVTSYDAFVKSGGASAYVFLADNENEALREEIYTLLSGMANAGTYGFSEVLRADEAKEKYGFYGDFAFVLETDGHTTFRDGIMPPAESELDFSDYRFGKGTHGHKPEKGPQPTFIAKGADFRRGVRIPTGHVLNHAPTIAKVLGLTLLDAEGSAVNEILA